MKRVLVVEDEANIRSFIIVNMIRAGYDVVEAESGEQALNILKETSGIDVALLDVMLPGIDGYEVCRRIRATNQKMGIIMLTAKSQEEDKVMGLMTGADDYVTKPFSPVELTARVDALYRRSGGGVDRRKDDLAQGPFVLNTKNQTLQKNGKRIRITQVEYGILKYFMEHVGKVVTREELQEAVWGKDDVGELKTVDVNVRRLRMKLEENPQSPSYLTTVWGTGYKWSY